ncbi:MAG: fibronectin type III domain-containing protein [Clostridia bacterium]|nr:fibronectin type III domain-containing protein [Clostridia bacterium]
MKKANKAFKSLALSLFFSLLLTVAVSASAPRASAANATSRRSQVFSYLTQNIGFNSAAACGIMSNIEHESDFNPALVIIDSNGLPSGGLCQWNGGRFRNLMSFCNNNGYDYLSITGQLAYLKHELQKSEFRKIYNYMRSVPNTQEGAYNAGYYWCYYFEVPSNRASRSASRAAAAVNTYWPNFCVNNISAVLPTSKADDKTLDIDRLININWNKASGNYTGYGVYIAKKTGDDFDWENAIAIPVGAQERRVTLDLSKLGLGRFAVRVFAYNAANGFMGDCDNTIKFNVECLEHRFETTKVVDPTFNTPGKKIMVCEKCGEKQTITTPKLSLDAFESGTISGFDVTEKTADTVTVVWDAFRGAQGYRIYQLVDGEWVKLRRMEADELTCTIKNLKAGTRYTFKVAAYAKNGSDTVYCDGSELSVYTRPTGVKLTDIDNGQGKVWLQWTASKKAEGYSVFASTNANSGFEEVRTVKSGKTETAVNNLTSGVRYYFYVCSYITNTKGNKIYSDPSNVMFAVVK